MRKFAYILLGAGIAVAMLAFAYSAQGQAIFRVFQGGTGTSSPSGILKGNGDGTTPLQTAVPGVDYIGPSYYATTTHANISSLPSLTITENQISDLQNYLLQSAFYGTTTHANLSSLPSLSITESQISDLGAYLTGVAWGDLTGTLANQTDLQAALNGKIEVGTTSVASITTLSNLTITESQISDLDHWTIADFVAALAATTSVGSITALPNLLTPES